MLSLESRFCLNIIAHPLAFVKGLCYNNIGYFVNIFLGVREMQDHIFVLLMQTGTSVAKVLHFFTRKPYNHASVALDGGIFKLCTAEEQKTSE